MNDQQRLTKLGHDISLLKRVELRIVEAISLENQRTQLLSISPDVEELRRDVGGKE
jgi:hypothetical protein